MTPDVAEEKVTSLGKRIDGLSARQKVLDARIGAMLTKATVLGEVGYSARHNQGMSEAARCELLAAAVYGLEHPDDWWTAVDPIEAMTVAEWARRLLRAYRIAKDVGTIKDFIARADA